MALDPPRHPFLNRVDRRFTTDDINERPRRYYFRRVDARLDISDIDGAQAGRHLTRWPRCVDPLNPVYHLPSFVHEPPEPMRFTRNTLDISDIEGTRTTVPIVLRMKTRDHINYDDVPGSVAAHALARWAARPIRPIMRVADINDSGRFRSRRRTDPLSPRYVINNADVSGLSSVQAQGEIVIGDIPGSHPKTIRARAVPSFTLLTRDIEGNEPMWRVHRQMKISVRRMNATDDIEGAQADTAGRWHWTRRTNPLAPDYQALDRGDPPLNPLTAPNIGLDIHELYLDAERQRLRSAGFDSDNYFEEDKEDGLRSVTTGEMHIAVACSERTAPVANTISSKAERALHNNQKISSMVCWKSPAAQPLSSCKSVRSQATSRKAPSLREIRERQEKAQDQALVKALPAL